MAKNTKKNFFNKPENSGLLTTNVEKNNQARYYENNFNSFMTEVPIIQKLVYCFVEQINGLFSI